MPSIHTRVSYRGEYPPPLIFVYLVNLPVGSFPSLLPFTLPSFLLPPSPPLPIGPVPPPLSFSHPPLHLPCFPPPSPLLFLSPTCLNFCMKPWAQYLWHPTATWIISCHSASCSSWYATSNVMATGSSNTYSLSIYNIHAKSNHTLPIIIIQPDSATTFRTNSP